MRDFLSRLWSVLPLTFHQWMEHDAPRMGAALAFYALLSLSPLAVLVPAMIGHLVGPSMAQEQFIAEIQQMIGPQGADAVRVMMDHAAFSTPGTVPSIFSVITLLFGASGVFVELRFALNRIWEVPSEGQDGLAQMIKTRFSTFAMVLTVGFLLLVSLLVSAVLAALGELVTDAFPVPKAILSTVDFTISFAGVSLLFGLIFKYVPETDIAWRDLWKGAIATAFLFNVGKFLIGIYLGNSNAGEAYGTARSFVVLVLWVYYSSMIFFFGAELSQVLTRRPGRHLAARDAKAI